jgi:hypothetical protein
MRMISFTIADIDLDKIDHYLSEVPNCWKKTRGKRYWSSSLVLVANEQRQIENNHLMVVEWMMTGAINYSIQISILIDSILKTCEIFIPGFWYPQKKLAEAIRMVFKKDEPQTA